MQVKLTVVASDDDRYWDPDKVELEVNVSSDVDELAISSATSALLYFKKLIKQAVEERGNAREEADRLKAIEEALEAAVPLEEETNEDSTD